MSRGYDLKVQTQIQVERLVKERGTGATVMHVLDRTTGQRRQYHARRYVLAAGAYGSALLLLRSGFQNPLIGRNYMLHLCSIVAGVHPQETDANSTFIKQVGFSDFYFGTKKYPQKMGVVQSLAVPGPLTTAKASPFLPASVRTFLRKRLLPLAGIIDDLLNPNNRVSLVPTIPGRSPTAMAATTAPGASI